MRTWRVGLLKGSLFLFIFGICLIGLDYVFIPKEGSLAKQMNATDAFYQQPKNSNDVVYIGASAFMRGISPLTIWEAYGITGFVRAAPAQIPLVSYYVFLETLRYQSPKLVVLDASLLFKDISKVDEQEEWLRVAVDPLRFSEAKMKLIFEIHSNSKNQSILSYLIPFFRYHSRWDQISKADFLEPRRDIRETRYKGFRPSLETEDVISSEEDDMSNEVEFLPQTAMNYYDKIIQICRKQQINVILLAMPMDFWTPTKRDLVQNFANSRGLEYLDYSTEESIESIGLDPLVDFKDINHLNITGGLKVTTKIAEYIHENYPFADRRSQPEYAGWEKDLSRYNNWLEKNVPGIPQQD